MSKVSINRTFTMPVEEVKQGMQTLAEGLKAEHGMQYDWAGDNEVKFKHKAGQGSLKIVGNELQLLIKIPMLFAATAPILKKKINTWADENIH